MAKIQKLNKDMIVYVILFLFLVMFFLKPGFFSQLFQRVLGRSFLVFLIIYITYCNQIGGTFFVLFLIIFYSGYLNYDYSTMDEHYQAYDNEFNENYSLLEGFSSSKATKPVSSSSPASSSSPVNTVSPIVRTAPATTNSTTSSSPATTTPETTTSTTASSPATPASTTVSTPSTTLTTTPATTTTKSNVALEGFDLLGFEDTMKRGKQSNSIFVSNKYSMNDHVMPYDHSMFSY